MKSKFDIFLKKLKLLRFNIVFQNYNCKCLYWCFCDNYFNNTLNFIISIFYELVNFELCQLSSFSSSHTHSFVSILWSLHFCWRRRHSRHIVNLKKKENMGKWLSITKSGSIVPFLKKINLEGSTIKPVYNDHPLDPKIMAVVDRWSLFRGHLCNKSSIWDLKILVVIDRRSLFGGGR